MTMKDESPRSEGVQYANMNLGKLWEMVRNRVTWGAAVHGVAKSQAWLGDWTPTTRVTGSIRFHRLRPLSHNSAPTSGQSQVQLLLVLLANWVQIEASVTFFLGLINFVGQLWEFRKLVIWIYSWMKRFLGQRRKDLKCRNFCLHGFWAPVCQHRDRCVLLHQSGGLWTMTSLGLIEASLLRHDWLNLWPVVMELNLQPHLPGGLR